MGTTPERPLSVGTGEDGNSEFGRLFREARLKLDRSAKDVAQEAQVSPAFVRMIERGERAPSSESARKLLKAVGIPFKESDEKADLVLRPPGEVHPVFVAFKAATKGDNRKWAMERLLVPWAGFDRSAQESDPAVPGTPRATASRPDRGEALLAILPLLAVADATTLGMVRAYLEAATRRQPDGAERVNHEPLP